MGFWGDFGKGVANSGAGGLLGIGMDWIGKGMDRKYAQDMAKFNQNIWKQNQMFANEQALQMWKDTNASAQVKELDKAGLSRGLMYGGGGAGGSTMGNASAQGGSAGSAPNFMGIGLQLKQMQQQAVTQAKQNKILDEQGKQETIKTQELEAGLEDRIDGKKAEAYGNRRRAEARNNVDLGSYDDAKTWAGTNEKVSRYAQNLLDKYEGVKVGNLVQETQKALNEATAKNLVSNDELIELQTKMYKAEISIIESDAFKKLPVEAKALIMALMKKFGAM